MTAADTNECELFTYSGDDSHIVYKNLCSTPNDDNKNREHIAYLRQSISAMWQKFKPLADSHFMTEFPRMPDQRYWEMYLGSCLANREFSVTSADSGPDCNWQAANSPIKAETNPRF
jgi:hypothetical protein